MRHARKEILQPVALSLQLLCNTELQFLLSCLTETLNELRAKGEILERLAK